jgi:Tfp pilus assembly protein PilV
MKTSTFHSHAAPGRFTALALPATEDARRSLTTKQTDTPKEINQGEPCGVSLRILNASEVECQRRNGLTLLEIVLSLAVFFGGVTALAQLAWNGSRAAMQARFKTQATIRCQAKLNEVLAGAEAMQSQSGISFPDDSNWTWSEVISSGGYPDLVQIDITVSHQGPTQMANVSVTLRRWARPLTIFAQSATQQKMEADEKVKPQ